MRYTKGSFITVPNKEGLRGMKPQTQCLFLWLCSYANETGKCFPSKKTLARDTGCSESSVLRSMKELEEAGFVIKQEKKDKKTGRNQSNEYTILIGEGVSVKGGGCQRDGGGGCQRDALTKSIDELNSDKVVSQSETVEGSQINKMIDGFADVNPSFSRLYPRKVEREACRRLIKQHGYEKILSIVAFLPKSNASRFAPTITTPLELEKNLGKLIAWGQKEKDTSHKGKKIFI